MSSDLVELGQQAVAKVTKIRCPLTTEQLVEDTAAIGPEHKHHTHQRPSGHHTLRHRQGELFRKLRFPSLDEERN